MKLYHFIRETTRILLIGGILVNILLGLASGVFGGRLSLLLIYLFIYQLLLIVIPALLILLCLVLFGFIQEGFSKTVDGLKVQLVLAFFVILTSFAFILYAYYFTD